MPGFSSITLLSKQRREFLPGPLVVVLNSTVCRNQCILNVEAGSEEIKDVCIDVTSCKTSTAVDREWFQ